MASYPDSIYTPRTKANRSGVSYDSLKQTVVFAEDFQKPDAEIVAIETELGANPKGIWASVAENLAELWSAISGFVTSFIELSDAPASYADQAGKVVKVNAEETGLEFGVAGGGEKCTGAEINTGTDDAKFATPKAIADSNIAFLGDIPTVPVKATGAEINTGADDAKFATPKAIADSNIAFLSDIPSVVNPAWIPVSNGTFDVAGNTDVITEAFSIANLLGDTHEIYKLTVILTRYDVSLNLGAGLRFNSDAGAGQYQYKIIGAVGRSTTIAALEATATYIPLGAGAQLYDIGDCVLIEIIIKATKLIASSRRSIKASASNSDFTGTIGQGSSLATGFWLNTADNLTSIQFIVKHSTQNGTTKGKYWLERIGV